MSRNQRLFISLALTLMMLFGAVGAHATPPASVGPTAGQPTVGNTQTVTLITGDRVTIRTEADGRKSVLVDPAVRGGVTPTFKMTQTGEDIYVIPLDAARFIPDKLDLELFNVAGLLRQGYADAVTGEVPVIITYERGLTAAAGLAATPSRPVKKEVPGFAKKHDLPVIRAAAGGFAKSDTSRFGQAIAQAAAERSAGNSSPALFTGIRKIWLDRKIIIDLDRSTGQIGAPDAWAAGYDGTGVTVAVLDTGVDETHPDLAGKVINRNNFSSESSANDGHGHGTHVASTIAGTGAASDGLRKGVAPGAMLLSGKVLDNDGSGQFSWLIDGMTWACNSGAKVVSMSLGAMPTDGTDPMSEALNTLSHDTGALFVIAAGNSGPFSCTVSTPGSANAALTVGAVDRDGVIANFSSRGPRLGDYAIKPDVTAPGVGIVAARARGTTMGRAVDDYYTAASGTSMATPHVAGAAAILAQKQPTWTAEQLKAGLIASANPNLDFSVYDQGAGLINIDRAISEPVYVESGSISFGVQASNDLSPISREVVYHNISDQPVTLSLMLNLADMSGSPAPEALMTVDAEAVMIEPGATATVMLTVDPSQADSGVFGGYLTATSTDGVGTIHTPVAYCREADFVKLTVDVIGRDGYAAPTGWVDVVNVAEVNGVYQAMTDNGVAEFWLPAGTYSVAGLIEGVAMPESRSTDATLAAMPEVEVRANTHIVLDARLGVPVSIGVDGLGDCDVEEARLGYTRFAQYGGGVQTNYILGATPKDQIYATPTIATTLGRFEFVTRWTLVEPKIRMAIVGDATLALTPSQILGTSYADGNGQYPLVFAGLGNPGDYARLNVKGKIVLIERDPDVWSFDDKIDAATTAGAKLLLIHNNDSGYAIPSVGKVGGVPSYLIPRDQGLALRARLSTRPVTITATAKRFSSFRYDLVEWEQGQIPDNLAYTVDPASLATINERYFAQEPNHIGASARGYMRPGDIGSFVVTRPEAMGGARPEYVTAAGVQWCQSLYAANMPWPVGMQSEQWTEYEPGAVYSSDWWQQPARPGNVIASYYGSMAFFVLWPFTDSDPTHYGQFDFSTDTANVRTYTNDQLTGQYPMPYVPMFMASEPASYRIEMDVKRNMPGWNMSTLTKTAWVVHPELCNPGDELPMLFVDVKAKVDSLNCLLAPSDRKGPETIDLGVRYQYRLRDVEPEGVGAKLWVSYDDGAIWKEIKNLKVNRDGTFTGQIDSRASGKTSGYLSVKVEAWDKDGNRIEQTIIRAYGLGK